MPKKKTKTKHKPAMAARPSDRLSRRWVEMAGKRFKASAAFPPKLLAAIENLQLLQGGPGGPVAGPQVVVFARKVAGTGCEQKAEIAGWYSNTLAPGANCIGQAAVLAILNAAAAQECCKTIHCPTKCPCSYVPRQALASYTCQGGLEEGYLLQGTEVWNCFCFAQ